MQYDQTLNPKTARDRPRRQHTQHPTHSSFGLLTQNTRGFRDDNRQRWMAAWKERVEGINIHYIFIQETHVGSSQEATDLQHQWARAWGTQHDADNPLSFWSVAAADSAGVAILLRPNLSERFALVQVVDHPGRVLAVASSSITLINIYAPNDKSLREILFAELETAAHTITGKWFMAGDFNCVLDPFRDRTSARPRPDSTESRALSQLVTTHHLLDTAHHQPTDSQVPTTTLTYFLPQSDMGARLDRCYASQLGAPWVHGATTVIPKVTTDHMGFVTWLRDPDIRPRQRPLAPLHFPIFGRNQEAINSEIEAELRRIVSSSSAANHPWDVSIRHIADALREIRKREKRRARRAVLKWERRLRARIHTRQDLIDYEQGRLERRMARQHGQRLLRTPGATQTIFQRLKQRTTNLITKMEGPETLSVADRLATAWAPLLTTSHATVSEQDRHLLINQLFTIPDQHVLGSEDNAALLAGITSMEVAATIEDLGSHKAGGADRLNNDFYKAWSPILAEPLACEFNRILDGARMPPSFREAIIVPLPKKGASSNAMDYRPISLLPSSYKIMTKLLAHRLQRSLGRVINADQNGFVRGRDMANNIHLMQALLAQDYECEDEAADTSPVAVLLDFKKAYDSLDRGFLTEALAAFGYDVKFIRLIERLHEGTTARFLANGDLSTTIQVATGIRQGCPLAPLLFLIAAETLKYAIAQTGGLTGIPIAAAGVSFTHTFSAFVDDSVVFVSRGEMLAAVEDTLQRFAAVSGLQVQPTKSHAIVMNRRCTATMIGAFPVVPRGSTVPYLGVEIGLDDVDDANWASRLRKLQASLGAASRLTTSLHDRVTVLNTIGLPAILFTAKYAAPSPSDLRELDHLWRRYLWHGTITSTTLRAHKIAQPILELPRAELGLGLRDFREAMIAQAARMVLQWNSKTRDKYWVAFHRRLQDAGVASTSALGCYPSATDTRTTGMVDGKCSLLRLGWRRANASVAGRYPVSPSLNQIKTTAIQTAAGTTGSLRWLTSQAGMYSMPQCEAADWDHVSTMVYAAQPHEIRSFWGSFPWYDNLWVVDERGTCLKKGDFSGIRISTLGELELQPNGTGTYLFKNPSLTDPFAMRETQRRRLMHWLQVIIINSGFHRADPASWTRPRVYSVNAHPLFDRYEWCLEPETGGGGRRIVGTQLSDKWNVQPPGDCGPNIITASIIGWGKALQFLAAHGTEQTHTDLRELQDATAGVVILAGHPALHHGPTLLVPTGHYRVEPPRNALSRGLDKAPIRQRRHERALTQLLHRLQRAGDRDPAIQTALRLRSIAELHTRADGETEYQAIFRYRVALGALNLRSNTGDLMGCPHSWCAGHASPSTITHILWECDAAQRTWALIHRQWTRRDEIKPPDEYLRSSIGVDVPVLAQYIRRTIQEDSDDSATMASATRKTWQLIQAIVPHQLWLRRNSAAFQHSSDSVHAIAAKVWAAICRQLLSVATAKRLTSDTYAEGRVIKAIVDGINADVSPDQPSPGEARLYYDGGARGNPGPSGAGSLLLERSRPTDPWGIVWWAATYVGGSCTNNVAEHQALAQGLRAAANRYQGTRRTLDVVGDSMLVTHQLQGRFAVTNTKFTQPVHQARTALADLFDYRFHHTLRAGNKAADWLANHAMDHRSSVTSDTAGPEVYYTILATLDPLVRVDTDHPWSAHTHQSDVLATVQTIIAAQDPPDPSTPRKRPRSPSLLAPSRPPVPNRRIRR